MRQEKEFNMNNKNEDDIQRTVTEWGIRSHCDTLGGPDSSMVEHLVQFQKGLGSSPSPVTFHAAIGYGPQQRSAAVRISR